MSDTSRCRTRQVFSHTHAQPSHVPALLNAGIMYIGIVITLLHLHVNIFVKSRTDDPRTFVMSSVRVLKHVFCQMFVDNVLCLIQSQRQN